MILRLIIIAALGAITLTVPASAQLTTLGVGNKGFSVVAACGVGAVDLSTGCALPMLGGL
jgi:hypothetical protein